MNYASESAAGVSPVGLVIRIYENIVSDLGRAIQAVRDCNIERRTAQLQHALLLIAHLQSALDMNRGGDPARLLNRFYALARARILEAQMQQSTNILEEISRDFLSVREAWTQVENEQALMSTAPSPPMEHGSHVSFVA